MTFVLGVLLLVALATIGLLVHRQRAALAPPVPLPQVLPASDDTADRRLEELEREVSQQRDQAQWALNERNRAMEERDRALATHEGAVAEHQQLAAARDRAAAERDQAQFQAVKATREKERAEDETARLHAEVERLHAQYEAAQRAASARAEEAEEAQRRAEECLREFDLHEHDRTWLPSDGQPSSDEPDRPQPAIPQQLSLSADATADSVVDGADLGAVVVRAASVCGDRHRQRQQHRRDAVLLRMPVGLGGSTLLSAVAAGAPEGAWSQSAASHACRALVTQIQNQADVLSSWLTPRAEATDTDTNVVEDFSTPAAALRLALGDVGRAIRVEANNRGWSSQEGTVDGRAVEVEMTALLSPLGDRTSRTHLAFGTGDGMVLRLREGQWSTVFPVQDAGPGGPLLPSREARVRWDPIRTRKGDVLAVCSRPTAQLLLHEGTGDWFADRWEGRQPRLTSFLLHVSARVRAAVEDRSLVCLWDFGNAAEAERAAPPRR
ncbi:hypothetical protein ABZ348_29350 [Streptomyces sp. NPDC005963]|uniref:hypothetical protein n=1 Tax=Streptomyces sp. NPDC005963 TaxID=3156721 RepID=UPI0033F3AF5A